MAKVSKCLEQIEIVHRHAAGLDSGARAGETVRALGRFTPDVQRWVDWLVANAVDTVAMESTGVYWLPVYELLEARGLKVYLVKGRHIKHGPGRQSDVQDCQWIQKLPT